MATPLTLTDEGPREWLAQAADWLASSPSGEQHMRMDFSSGVLVGAAACAVCLLAVSRIGAQPVAAAAEAPEPLRSDPSSLADLMRRQAVSEATDFAGPWWEEESVAPWRDRLLLRAARFRHASDYLLAVERQAQEMEVAK